MKYDVIVVGGGMAGLTSAAYVSKAQKSVLLCEQADDIGGLVHSFKYKGYTFDGGIRAIENSGIIYPMLDELNIEVEWLPNHVTLGVSKTVFEMKTKHDLKTYQDMLTTLYPDEKVNIACIMREINKIMDYMDILYGIKNPLFLDIVKDRDYFVKEVIPWVFKYVSKIKKVNQLQEPVYDYLRRFTMNEDLIGMIAQHFFTQIPTSFALSYFSLYLDYKYPKGGTGTLSQALATYIKEHHGVIQTKTRIVSVDVANRCLKDEAGKMYEYQKLIWAGDLKQLYQIITNVETLKPKQLTALTVRQQDVLTARGGDSVLSLYVMVNLEPQYFKQRCQAHCFYTPSSKSVLRLPYQLHEVASKLTSNEALMEWVGNYLSLTTYEISIPVLRDETLAPPHKTGLIISTLMDFDLVKRLEENDQYEVFKQVVSDQIVSVLERTLFEEFSSYIEETFVATPLTMKRKTRNIEGAITGWAFTNDKIPSHTNMSKIMKTVQTPISHVYQAGQWTFSPSGLPIAVLTGKIAAQTALKTLTNHKK